MACQPGIMSADQMTRKGIEMHSFFPGNYRWSYNTLFAFAAGGEFGDVAMVVDRLVGHDGDDEAWIREWAWLADLLHRRAVVSLERNAVTSATENFFLSSLYRTIGEHFIPYPFKIFCNFDPNRVKEKSGRILLGFIFLMFQTKFKKKIIYTFT